VNAPVSRLTSLVYATGIALLLAAFFASRLDASHYIYYFGDGDAIVDLISLMLGNGTWDPNWAYLVDIIHPQQELMPFIEVPKPGEHFYHMGGYMVLGAVICKSLAIVGFHPPIQAVLHALNVVIQLGILALLWQTGKRLGNPAIGAVAMALFILFPLAMLEAHYERPESWLCLLTTLLLYCCFDFRPAPLRFSVITGAVGGLSMATKFSQLYLGLIPALLFARYLASTPVGPPAYLGGLAPRTLSTLSWPFRP